jgi:alpha-beta hydrolase superfamily lysophospholipase
MNKMKFAFTGCEGMELNAVLWRPAGNAVAVVQIIHGMTEHMGRYDKLAEFLTSRGIAVAGFDLRGHGESKLPGGEDGVASFGEGGWAASLKDINLFSQALREVYPKACQVMLGFSLGSFLLREYLSRYDERPDAAILMGTGQQPGWLMSIMAWLMNGQIKKVGFNGTSSLVRMLSFDAYNRKFAPNRTEADWLCSDEKELDIYCADKLVQPEISAGLFRKLMLAMKDVGEEDACYNWPKNLPVLLLSGESDPVGGFGKGVEKVYNQLQDAGLTKTRMMTFPDARHDLLHEEESGIAQKVRTGIALWVEGLVASQQEKA